MKKGNENRTSIILDVEMRQKKAKIIQAFLVIFFIIVSMAFFLPILWMMMPPIVFSSAGAGRISTLSANGLMFIMFIFLYVIH